MECCNTKLEDDAIYWKQKYETLYGEYRAILNQLYNSRTQNQLYVEIIDSCDTPC